MVADVAGQPVEVQVRTKPQHVWAELSEKLADRRDPALKYGGGPPRIRQALENFSAVVSRVDHAGGKWTIEGASISTLVEVFESLEK